MSRARVAVIMDGFHAAYRERLVAALGEDDIEVVPDSGPPVTLEVLDDSAAALLGKHEPDIVCVACGPWNGKPGGDLIDLSAFERATLRAAEVCRRWCGRQVVFVNTPPVDPARWAGLDGTAVRGEAEGLNRVIVQYNQLAAGLLGQLNVAVADLYGALDRDREAWLGADGLGLSAAGLERAAAEVAKGVCGLLRA